VNGDRPPGSSGHVSRETDDRSADPPPAAAAAFGPRLGLARRYAGLLTGPGVERGLIGPREVPRLWDRHLLNCVVLGDLIRPGVRVCDLGSGAGLPGLVLAIARPDLHIVLLEPSMRRVTFLGECVAQLDLTNVQIRRGRAEDLAGRLAVDVVTARAVAPLRRLAGWALPLLLPGGVLLALKGAAAAQELAGARVVLSHLGVASAEVVQVGDGIVAPPARVVRIVRGRRIAPHRAGTARCRAAGRGRESR
jgi:16S rRNA (guanine527-N7)-methyltransferase